MKSGLPIDEVLPALRSALQRGPNAVVEAPPGAGKSTVVPIALLEALASGLPVACNSTPTLEWMAGPAGRLTDITSDGALADQFVRESVKTQFQSALAAWEKNDKPSTR